MGRAKTLFLQPKNEEKKNSANVTSCPFKIWWVSSLLVFITKMLAERSDHVYQSLRQNRLKKIVNAMFV
jgi:hypothetical protein